MMRLHVLLHPHRSPTFGFAEVIGLHFAEDTFRESIVRLRFIQSKPGKLVTLLFPDGTVRTVDANVMNLTDPEAVLELNRRKAVRPSWR